MKHLLAFAPCVLLCTFACKTPTAPSSAANTLDLKDLSSEEDVDAAHPPPVPLAESIVLALGHAPEGRLLHAELGRKNGSFDCLATVWSADGMHIVDIDIESGAVLHEGRSELDDETATHARNLAQPTRTLIGPGEAIANACAALPGAFASSITLAGDFAEPVYTVELVAGKERREIQVSARDGSVQAQPARSD